MNLAVHKLSSALEWTMGITYVFVGSVSSGFNSVIAQAQPSDGGIDLNNWNTQVVVIGLGVAAVAAKFVDTFMNGYKQFLVARSNSDHGKLAQCMEERETERKVAAEALFAERTAHAADLDRCKAQYEAMVRDYEDRLENKRDEAEYLKQMIAAGYEAEKQLRQANEALTATLVQQNQAFVQQNNQITDIANRSVENTSAAIKKIPKVVAPNMADSDLDIHTMSVVSEHTNIVVTPDPDRSTVKA
jgi:Skp family chaperone for outer membrane proteins